MKRERGVTLVEILIGLLVSSIAVAGMLLTFRNAIQITARAEPAAADDAQRIAALLRAHMLVQKAGYGIANPANNTDLLAANLVWSPGESGGTLAATDNSALGESLLWSSDTDLDGVPLCEGVVPDVAGGLFHVSAACANASGWQSVQDWTGVQLVASSSAESSSAALTISDTFAPCSPVGAGDPATDILEGINLTLSITLSTGITVPSSTCLYNFSSATP